jgi:UDP-N-acetylglucosamine diphosphorylase/glucosamine-1-phosphate N-acetyltransferase
VTATVPPALVLYDDSRARTFEPFALTRPASEIRAGALLVRERWARVAGARATAFVGAPHLAAFREFDSPPSATGTLPAGSVIAQARFAPSLDATLDAAASVWRCDGRAVAVRLDRDIDAGALADGALSLDDLRSGDGVSLEGWWIDEPWDYLRHLIPMLGRDIPSIARVLDRDDGTPLTTLGAGDAVIERGAYIEPYVVADTTAGPVLVRRGSRVSAFTRLVGPCFIGADVVVGGGKISQCSIGEQSRVHGELSTTIFIGHANKGHDGFVGHSMLGRWVNLGAGTITSNLKNSYGDVALWTPDGVRPTGLQFLGTLFGDHMKAGIGTRFTTGTVVGAGANIFGSVMPPKFVPPFAWGDREPFGVFDQDKFLQVAERVMARRGAVLDAAARTVYAAAFARRTHFTG